MATRALARMLEFIGQRVEREFYVNDAGSQVRTFGESIQALARGERLPENGYQGDYIAELAQRISDAATSDPADVGRAAVAMMVGEIQQSLTAFGVKKFDHWAYESELQRGPAEPRRPGARWTTGGAKHTLRRGRRPEAAQHDVRRRQGSRARALQRGEFTPAWPPSPTTRPGASARL